jgi:hypothetical protein
VGTQRARVHGLQAAHLQTCGIHVVGLQVRLLLLVLDILGVLQVRFEPVLRQYGQLDAPRRHQQDSGEDKQTCTCKTQKSAATLWQ